MGARDRRIVLWVACWLLALPGAALSESACEDACYDQLDTCMEPCEAEDEACEQQCDEVSATCLEACPEEPEE